MYLESNIYLKPIDKDNWEEAIHLSVKDEQKNFVASNLYSIAQVQFLENFKAMGVYRGNDMVGFTMFGIDPDDGNYWIYRVMVDKEHQGKGIGVKAVEHVVEEIKKVNTNRIPYVMIGYHPENMGAKFTYKKAGFVETEIAPWGEQLARFTL